MVSYSRAQDAVVLNLTEALEPVRVVLTNVESRPLWRSSIFQRLHVFECRISTSVEMKSKKRKKENGIRFPMLDFAFGSDSVVKAVAMRLWCSAEAHKMTMRLMGT